MVVAVTHAAAVYIEEEEELRLALIISESFFLWVVEFKVLAGLDPLFFSRLYRKDMLFKT